MRVAHSICWILIVLISLACAPAGTRKTSSAKAAKNVTASVPELTSRNQSLLAVYSAEVANAADEIARQSHSSAARRLALEWKAEAIPVMQASLLKTDPVAAVVDTWAFLFQMKSFMEGPSLKQTFGDLHPIVTQTLRKMDSEMERVVRLGAPNADVAALRQRVSAWADAHPIQVSLTGRESVDPEFIKKAQMSDLGTRASIKALGESIGDLSARLDSYNVYAPKQARWQAELLLIDMTADPAVAGGLANLNMLTRSALDASSSVDKLPAALAQAREAVIADFEGQRLSGQAFLRQERLETLDVLRRERIETIASMRGERLAATADLRVERQLVLNAIHDDQQEVMYKLQAMSDKGVKDLDDKGRGLIDHFVMRALQLMLLAFVLCALATWLLVRWILASTNRQYR